MEGGTRNADQRLCSKRLEHWLTCIMIVLRTTSESDKILLDQIPHKFGRTNQLTISKCAHIRQPSTWIGCIVRQPFCLFARHLELTVSWTRKFCIYRTNHFPRQIWWNFVYQLFGVYRHDLFSNVVWQKSRLEIFSLFGEEERNCYNNVLVNAPSFRQMSYESRRRMHALYIVLQFNDVMDIIMVVFALVR